MDHSLLDSLTRDSINFLVKIAQVNSGTGNLEGIGRIIALVEEALRPLGFENRSPQDGIYLAQREGRSGKNILLVGHMDTVFPPEHPFRQVRKEDNILYGPGVGDMKGGLSLAVHLLHYLSACDMLGGCGVTVLFNSDEETGSFLSRDLIGAVAAKNDAALIFEGGKRVDERTTTYISSRKGSGKGIFTLCSTDESAAFAFLSQRLQNTSLPGNVEITALKEPEHGRIEAAFRCSAKKELGETEAFFRSIVREKAETFSALEFSVYKPPMEPDRTALEYGKKLEALSREIGYPMVEKSRSGTSDGNFTGFAGASTLDAVGPVGDGWHTEHEYLELDSIRKRMELLAKLWRFL